VVVLIPKGRVTSYGAIARYLGTSMSARMVGWAMNAAHTNKKIPAHRVVNRIGLLTGKHHFVPSSSMQARLEREGVNVKKDKVVDFEKRFWDPAEELG
jgi:methylated-DNA-protein-cysteine methyltransferase-like protein